jgi:hypothetical protein
MFTLLAQFGPGFQPPASNKFDPFEDFMGTATECQSVWALEQIVSNMLGLITVIAGLAFLMYFVFGGLQWTLAGGDQGKVDGAKKQMTNGAIGLIIIIVSYGIMAVVGQVVGLNILNPAQELLKLDADQTQDC